MHVVQCVQLALEDAMFNVDHVQATVQTTVVHYVISSVLVHVRTIAPLIVYSHVLKPVDHVVHYASHALECVLVCVYLNARMDVPLAQRIADIGVIQHATRNAFLTAVQRVYPHAINHAPLELLAVIPITPVVYGMIYRTYPTLRKRLILSYSLWMKTVQYLIMIRTTWRVMIYS
jgi:hypothetical protein